MRHDIYAHRPIQTLISNEQRMLQNNNQIPAVQSQYGNSVIQEHENTTHMC